MNHTFTDSQVRSELAALAASLAVRESHIVYNGDEYAVTPENRLAVLNSLLYASCYAPKQSARKVKQTQAAAALVYDEQFVDTLSRHNQSRERAEHGWQLRQVNPANGYAALHRNGKECTMHLSSLARTPGQALAAGELLSVRFPREDRGNAPAFYYAFGNRTADHKLPLLRIYWNITANGAAPLVDAVTTIFNKYEVPFIFKCLNHPVLYTRRDAAVLYVEESSYAITGRLLPELIDIVQPYLQSDVPLFAYACYPGVGVAESPSAQESFGMHRMRLLAASIIAANQAVYSDKELIQLAADAFAEAGIDPRRPHLNKGTQSLLLN